MYKTNQQLLKFNSCSDRDIVQICNMFLGVVDLYYKTPGQVLDHYYETPGQFLSQHIHMLPWAVQNSYSVLYNNSWSMTSFLHTEKKANYLQRKVSSIFSRLIFHIFVLRIYQLNMFVCDLLFVFSYFKTQIFI